MDEWMIMWVDGYINDTLLILKILHFIFGLSSKRAISVLNIVHKSKRNLFLSSKILRLEQEPN